MVSTIQKDQIEIEREIETETHLKNLIRLIHAKTELTDLVNGGLRYGQISQLLELAVKQEYIIAKDRAFEVTPKGLAVIHNKSSKSYADGGWVHPLGQDDRVPSADPMQVYLPSRATARRLLHAISASEDTHRGGESPS